ncbi:MAG TPA: 8-amino-7-oxononanoate synthase [Solirubrobacteraceae bacterium]|nr:8-amino-7-oxononanoate synthase [Solirubrobacteraceae bacterium]
MAEPAAPVDAPVAAAAPVAPVVPAAPAVAPVRAMTAWLADAAAQRAALNRVRVTDATRHPTPGDGRLDLASNDYLSLLGDPRLAAAAIAAIERDGTGAGASRVVTGTAPVHDALEAALCELTGQPAGLVFSSGYAANLAVLTALGDPDTRIISDAHIHASLIDAARLSRSPVTICPHGDLDALEALLRGRTEPRAIIVVESIYSVLGDAADLPALADLAQRHDAVLVVDEAHGIGVAGAGRGAVHAAGLAGRPDVIVTATLSKALGSQGGAVLSSAEVRDHLVNTARAFIFDTGLAPAAAAAAGAAAAIILAEPDRVAALHRAAEAIATAAGIAAAPGAVQSLPVGDPKVAVLAASRLEAEGILVGCFRPPSVPDGISRLRLTARAGIDPRAAAGAAARARAVLGGLGS